MIDVSVIIINYNTRGLLEKCIESVYEYAHGVECEIIVVDNASTDGSPEIMRSKYPRVMLLENRENVGFASGNNQGYAHSSGRALLLLNSDAMLTPFALPKMLDVLDSQPQIGVVGAQLRNMDGSFQASYSHIPDLFQEFLILSGLGRLIFGRHYPSHGAEEDNGPCQVGYVEGACMLIRREAYQQAEGLDEGYFMFAEEVDFCLQLSRQGWQVWYQPAAIVYHVGGGSSLKGMPKRETDLYQSRVRFFRKHYGNFEAELLKAMIYSFTVIKTVYHFILQKITHGKHGRQIVSLRALRNALRRV